MQGRLLLLGLGVFSLLLGWFVVWQMWRYQDLARDVAWLDDRRFETLSVVTAGTGSAYENPRRLGPVTAVGLDRRLVLVDAGRAVAEALRGCAIRPSQPDTVLLTSLLPENTLGLDDLLVAGWLAGREQPLRLVGTPGTRALAAAIEAGLAPSLEAQQRALGLPAAGARFEVVDASDGFRDERDGLVIRAGAVGARPLPGLAWRFEAGGISAVVSGSGPDAEALAEFARGAALLVAEGFFRESIDMALQAGDPDADRLRREAEQHLAIPEVGEIAARAEVPLLVLTRLRPPPLVDVQYENAAGARYAGTVAVAHDCREFTQARR